MCVRQELFLIVPTTFRKEYFCYYTYYIAFFFLPWWASGTKVESHVVISICGFNYYFPLLAKRCYFSIRSSSSWELNFARINIRFVRFLLFHLRVRRGVVDKFPLPSFLIGFTKYTRAKKKLQSRNSSFFSSSSTALMLFFSESESNQDVKIVIAWYKGRRSAFKGSFALRSRAGGVTMMAFNIQGRKRHMQT